MTLYDASLRRCQASNNYGQHCEKAEGHTGAHRYRMFSAEEAQRIFDDRHGRYALRERGS